MQRGARQPRDHRLRPCSIDDAGRDHHTPKTYGLESYIAAPIVLSDGEFFGTLCSIDPRPARASAPSTIAMFELFAKLIAAQIESGRRFAHSQAALLEAHGTSELRAQFIAVLGHDLRNPIAAIDAGVILLEKRADERTGPIVREMRGSVRRIEGLVNDILDFARGRLGGGLTVARRPAEDLPAALLQVVEELKASHPGRTVDTRIEIPLAVACDPDRLAQLASNLLANALAHGDAAHPITLHALIAGDSFELVVVNRGAPIPAHLIPRLFRPFNRKGSDIVREGLGLGLYIASEIAKAHRGEILVASDEHETRFTFRMPSA